MINIITTCFGDKFTGGVERLGRQIESLNKGYNFGVITETSIRYDKKLSHLKLFFDKNEHLKATSKGYYWYVWKPIILLRFINEIKENEVFVYLDAGTEISLIGCKNFEVLIEQARREGTFFFRNPQKINEWTKENTLKYFDSDMFNIKLMFKLN